MGKVRINTIGDESLEQEQKIKAEKRKEAKSHPVKASSEAVETAGEAKLEEHHAKPAEKKVVVKHAAPVVEAPQGKKSTRSKKYQSVVTQIEKNKVYTIADALAILPQIHLAKFDETVELHINTYTTGVSGS